MTREEAIKILKAGADIIDYPHSYEEFEEALQMSIEALRAQQPSIKLDRSRWEECDSCGNQKIKHLLLDHSKKYCPNCGHPLTEAAWAELERRINDGTND